MEEKKTQERTEHQRGIVDIGSYTAWESPTTLSSFTGQETFLKVVGMGKPHPGAKTWTQACNIDQSPSELTSSVQWTQRPPSWTSKEPTTHSQDHAAGAVYSISSHLPLFLYSCYLISFSFSLFWRLCLTEPRTKCIQKHVGKYI